MEFGFLRETQEKADKTGRAKSGVCRTGLDTYLLTIFPNVDDWVHDKCVPNCPKRTRPDYRSEKLKLIVEFDGLPHYQNPLTILKDSENKKMYEDMGYKVVRIPYFIQLSNTVVENLFNIRCDIELFDETIPSLSVEDKCTPAFLCKAGIKRMAQEFKDISMDQYYVNVNNLESYNDEYLTGLSQLQEYMTEF